MAIQDPVGRFTPHALYRVLRRKHTKAHPWQRRCRRFRRLSRHILNILGGISLGIALWYLFNTIF